MTGSAFAQISITAAKLLPVGSIVTTTGTISTGAEYGSLRYMQDYQAGIAMYGNALENTSPGDSVSITGVLSWYRGELQLSPVMSYQLIATQRPLTFVQGSDFSSLLNGSNTSRLVAMSCSKVASCEAYFTEGPFTSYDRKGNIIKMIVDDNFGFEFSSIPDLPSIHSGVLIYRDQQYQLLLRDIAEAAEGNCMLLAPARYAVVSAQPILRWSVQADHNAWIVWGDSIMQEWMPADILENEVVFAPTELESGVLYDARLAQLDQDGDTILSPKTLFTSPVVTTPVEILFNRSVNASFSDGSVPLATGASVIETDVIQRIDQVQQTLDIAMYNTGRSPIVQAVRRAVQRGVKVRYIADNETSNTALDGEAAFPILYRDGDGIMHNKVVIGDAAIPSLAFVWMGSTNFTTNQLSTDPNHACIIKDPGMALSYTHEFDEMWGMLPNHSDGFTGEAKRDNSVHHFVINDMLVESVFSPSDETECSIANAIASADHQLLVGLLLLTSDLLTQEMIAAHQRGVEVRVIINDASGSSWALHQLQSAGVNVRIHEPSAIFHHKYAIIDEGYADADPIVISGSHNWTWSADHINDENTILFHDQRMANIFRQEYEARWIELQPTSIEDFENPDGFVFPNPVTDQIVIQNPADTDCQVDIISIEGAIRMNVLIAATEKNQLVDISHLPAGTYVLRWKWGKTQRLTRIAVAR